MVKRNVRMAKAMLKLSLRNAIISSLKVMLRNSRYLSRMCDGEKHIMIQTMASLMEPRPGLMWSHIPGVLKWICSSRLEHHAWILVVDFGICSNICVACEDKPDYVQEGNASWDPLRQSEWNFYIHLSYLNWTKQLVTSVFSYPHRKWISSSR